MNKKMQLSVPMMAILVFAVVMILVGLVGFLQIGMPGATPPASEPAAETAAVVAAVGEAAPAAEASVEPSPAPSTATPAPTDTPVPTATPTEAPVADACVTCHSDKDRLVALAKPEEQAESESKGVG